MKSSSPGGGTEIWRGGIERDGTRRDGSLLIRAAAPTSRDPLPLGGLPRPSQSSQPRGYERRVASRRIGRVGVVPWDGVRVVTATPSDRPWDGRDGSSEGDGRRYCAQASAKSARTYPLAWSPPLRMFFGLIS
jgi:hypothetical protein